VIFSAENSNKFQRIRFWKEKSVEDVVTLGPAAQATLILPEMRISSTRTAYLGFPTISHIQDGLLTIRLNSLKKVYIVNDFSMSFVVSNQLCNALFIYEGR
jgi:hypothetical protein